MSRDLQVCSPVRLPAVDTANPASMTELPAWLRPLIASVSDLGSFRVSMCPRTGEPAKRVPTIPASLMPNGPQRVAIAERVAELRAACAPGPLEEIGEAVGGLILARASYRMDQRTIDAKTTDYLDALHDLPGWTVVEAVRRWRRGTAGDDIPKEEYKFLPSSDLLRNVAERIKLAAEGQAIRLQRILDAEPDVKLTDAQLEQNAERLKAIASDAATKPATPARPGVASAEQEARDRETRAYWQRWIDEHGPAEQPDEAPANEGEAA